MAKANDTARKLERAGKVLHDDIGPLLSGAGLRLQLLRMDYPDTAERVREVTETLDQAIDRVRELSQQLKRAPESAPENVAALAGLSARYN
jgi:signal transduction histidine kinase